MGISILVFLIVVIIVIVVVVVVEKRDDDDDDDDDTGDDDDDDTDDDTDDHNEGDFEDSTFEQDPPVPDYLSFDGTPFLGTSNVKNATFLTRSALLLSGGAMRYTIEYSYDDGAYIISVSTQQSSTRLRQFVLENGNYRFIITMTGRLLVMKTENTSSYTFRMVNLHEYRYKVLDQAGNVLSQAPSGETIIASHAMSFSQNSRLYIDVWIPTGIVMADLYTENGDESTLRPHKEKVLLSQRSARYYIVFYGGVIYFVDTNLARLAGKIQSYEIGTFTLYNRGFFTLDIEGSEQKDPVMHIINKQQKETDYDVPRLYDHTGTVVPLPVRNENNLFMTDNYWKLFIRDPSGTDYKVPPEGYDGTSTEELFNGVPFETNSSNQAGYVIRFNTYFL